MSPLLKLFCFSAFVFSKAICQTCQAEINRFSNTGILTSSKQEVLTGEPILITCVSECAWEWHSFSINGDPIHSTPQSIVVTNIHNEVMNCPSCLIPAQQDCTDPDMGPTSSVLNVTFVNAGEYLVQCATDLFDLISPNWPNNIVKVYSEVLKIRVSEESGSSIESNSVMSTIIDSSLLRLLTRTSTIADDSIIQLTTSTTTIEYTTISLALTTTILQPSVTSTDIMSSSLTSNCICREWDGSSVLTSSISTTLDLKTTQQRGEETNDISSIKAVNYLTMIIVTCLMSFVCSVLIIALIALLIRRKHQTSRLVFHKQVQ